MPPDPDKRQLLEQLRIDPVHRDEQTMSSRTWWIVAALLFHAVSYWGGLTQRFVTISGVRAYEKEFFYSCMAFFLILPAVFGPQHRGRPFR